MQHFWVSYPNEGHKLLTGVFIRTVKEKDAISTVIMWQVWCKAGMVCEMYEGGVSPAMSMRTHAMADGIASYIPTCQGRCKAAGLTVIFQNSVNSTFYQNNDRRFTYPDFWLLIIKSGTHCMLFWPINKRRSARITALIPENTHRNKKRWMHFKKTSEKQADFVDLYRRI